MTHAGWISWLAAQSMLAAHFVPKPEGDGWITYTPHTEFVYIAMVSAGNIVLAHRQDFDDQLREIDAR